ncbi:TMEM192 family [Carpediemonas membranifera]|uniref:TMEM192 family n=1 Tax=Carpediemonas membranifera TaxID=201153 RepID=A0A8J6AXU4_9EUKA|nr:TMEM192 family [Carpediemonas membranifera]|eukprot:KAG9397501.1 TMEM192 family [Carpediemonas membranifera]
MEGYQGQWNSTNTDFDEPASALLSILSVENKNSGSQLTAQKFKAVHSWWSIMVQIIFGFVYFVYLMFPLADSDKHSSMKDHFAFRGLLHVVYFYLTFAFSRLQLQQVKKVRNAGFLDFYRAVRWPRKAPVSILTQGSVFILVLSIISPYFSGVQTIRIVLLRVVIGLEIIVVLCFNLSHLFLIVRHNFSRSAPDATKMLSSVDVRTFVTGSSESSIISKQSELIRFFKQHELALSKRIEELEDKVNYAGGKQSVVSLKTTIATQQRDMNALRLEIRDLEETVEMMRIEMLKKDTMIRSLNR